MTQHETGKPIVPHRVGAVLPSVQGRAVVKPLCDKTPSPAANFAAIKQAWAEQVAGDKALGGIALRIALMFPRWLNRETLLAWPAQSTLAEATNSQVRSVRGALKQLEERGHLVCVSEFRGGRSSNRYRIVLREREVTPDVIESGSNEPLREGHESRGERINQTGQGGHVEPGSEAQASRGTPERTLEKNIEGGGGDGEGRAAAAPLSAKRAQEIIQEVMGADRVADSGYLLRE